MVGYSRFCYQSTMNSVFDLIRNLRIAPHPGRRCALPLGGEEFLLIMPGASMDIIRALTKEIRQDVKKLMVEDLGKPLGPITISLWAATFPEHGATREEIIRAADTALYRAKHDARDRVVVAG